jgi:hypothetical protein
MTHPVKVAPQVRSASISGGGCGGGIVLLRYDLAHTCRGTEDSAVLLQGHPPPAVAMK